MNKFKVFISATLLAACSSINPYTNTAAYLSELPYEWRPLGKYESYEMSQMELTSSAKDMESCTLEYSNWLEEANKSNPRIKISREESLLDILSCMELKGWHIVPIEIVVTSNA